MKHSVLEQIWIKGSSLDQRLPQHESLYPIGLKLARIEILHSGFDFFKMWKQFHNNYIQTHFT